MRIAHLAAMEKDIVTWVFAFVIKRLGVGAGGIIAGMTCAITPLATGTTPGSTSFVFIATATAGVTGTVAAATATLVINTFCQ